MSNYFLLECKESCEEGIECDHCSPLKFSCGNTLVAKNCRVTCGTCDKAPPTPGNELWINSSIKYRQ